VVVVRNSGAILLFSLDFVNVVSRPPGGFRRQLLASSKLPTHRVPSPPGTLDLGHTDTPSACWVTEQSPKDDVPLERKLSHRIHICRHASLLTKTPHKRASLLIAISGVSLFVVPKIKVTCASAARRYGRSPPDASRTPRPGLDANKSRLEGGGLSGGLLLALSSHTLPLSPQVPPPTNVLQQPRSVRAPRDGVCFDAHCDRLAHLIPLGRLGSRYLLQRRFSDPLLPFA